MAIFSALRNTRLLRFVLAYAGSAVSEWSSWLAVLVYAEDRAGSAAAGWTALALLVPAVAVAPFVGRMADGRRPIRALTTVYAVQGVTLAVAAWLAADGASVAAVTIPVAVSIGGIAVVRPAYPVIAPALVRSARELTASNLFAGYCDSSAVLFGPIIATAFLALGGPEVVLAVCAVLAAAGVACTATLLTHDRPSTTGTAAAHPSMRDVLRAARARPNVGALLAVLGTQHVTMGFIGPMFVILAVDELGMSGSGAGVLNIAFGIGAVCSAVGATVLAGRSRLAPVVAMSLGAVALSLAAVGAVTAVGVAVVGLAAAGLSRSLLDVTSRMLLQRSAPPQLLAGVFAFVEVLTSVGLAVGTVLAQIAVATVGARWGFVLMAMVPALVLVATARQVWRADRLADVPVVAIALFRGNPVFAPLPPAALESVARAATEHHVDAGVSIIRQGDPGDRYYVVAAGQLEVRRDGATIGRLSRGDGAGEAALLTDAPRNASVVSTEPSIVVAVDRDPFLLAVTGHDDARVAAWLQAERSTG